MRHAIGEIGLPVCCWLVLVTRSQLAETLDEPNQRSNCGKTSREESVLGAVSSLSPNQTARSSSTISKKHILSGCQDLPNAMINNKKVVVSMFLLIINTIHCCRSKKSVLKFFLDPELSSPTNRKSQNLTVYNAMVIIKSDQSSVNLNEEIQPKFVQSNMTLTARNNFW